MSREINVGDVWARREKLDDAYDVVRVVGLVDHAGTRPSEWTIASELGFHPVLQTDVAGFDCCDLVSSGDPDEKWETDL
jgi:hypothetical protein